MGRSRGGLTTKIHALVDALGRPIRLKLTEGQAHDGRSASDMFDTIQAGNILLADRAYDSDDLRNKLTARGAWANIRPMPNRIRHPVFSSWVYRQRNALRDSSTNSNTSALSQPDMTNATTTTSHPSNSPLCEYGFELMSR